MQYRKVFFCIRYCLVLVLVLSCVVEEQDQSKSLNFYSNQDQDDQLSLEASEENSSQQEYLNSDKLAAQGQTRIQWINEYCQEDSKPKAEEKVCKKQRQIVKANLMRLEQEIEATEKENSDKYKRYIEECIPFEKLSARSNKKKEQCKKLDYELSKLGEKILQLRLRLRLLQCQFNTQQDHPDCHRSATTLEIDTKVAFKIQDEIINNSCDLPDNWIKLWCQDLFAKSRAARLDHICLLIHIQGKSLKDYLEYEIKYLREELKRLKCEETPDSFLCFMQREVFLAALLKAQKDPDFCNTDKALGAEKMEGP
jgi:hypothetical protein